MALTFLPDLNFKQPRAIARILDVGPGQALVAVPFPPLSQVPRARGTLLGLGRPTDPDTSQHRGMLKSVKPQVRQTQGVPRTVFEACSARSPVVVRSSARLITGRLSTVWGFNPASDP